MALRIGISAVVLVVKITLCLQKNYTKYMVPIRVILIPKKLPVFIKNIDYFLNLMQILKCKTQSYAVGELWVFQYGILKHITDLQLKAIKNHKFWKFPNIKKQQTIFVFTLFLLLLTHCQSEVQESVLASPQHYLSGRCPSLFLSQLCFLKPHENVRLYIV